MRYNLGMVRDELRDIINRILASSNPFSFEEGMEKLLKLIQKNMEVTASALDEDYFSPEEVEIIAENVREATLYTGISALAISLFSWTERHKDSPFFSSIRPFAEEAYNLIEGLPF